MAGRPGQEQEPERGRQSLRWLAGTLAAFGHGSDRRTVLRHELHLHFVRGSGDFDFASFEIDGVERGSVARRLHVRRDAELPRAVQLELPNSSRGRVDRRDEHVLKRLQLAHDGTVGSQQQGEVFSLHAREHVQRANAALDGNLEDALRIERSVREDDFFVLDWNLQIRGGEFTGGPEVKVAAGGWLSGDDYDPVKWPEVVATVRERLADARPWSVNQWRVVRP